MSACVLPTDLGRYLLNVDEVMYYLYLPLSERGSCSIKLPDERLKFVKPLLEAIQRDRTYQDFEDWYAYLTIKRQYVGPQLAPNRPGWHCDGYLSDDLNYVWYDCVPTIFTKSEVRALPQDHNQCLTALDAFHAHLEAGRITYPPHRLLRLDERVIHRVDTDVKTQVMRTFVKVALSKNRFNLQGNSKNPLLPDQGEFIPRDAERNDPYKEKP